MKKTLLLCLLFGLTLNTLFAYPIPARSLMDLVEEAPNIVVARVTKLKSSKPVTEKKTKPGRLTFHRTNNDLAELTVSEVLKGKIKEDKIHVQFHPGAMCPAPARYEENTHVIAFLERRKNSKHYRTTARSYGSKTLPDDQIKAYVKKIKELQTILKLSDETLKRTSSTNWLFECLNEGSPLREEALMELMDSSNYKEPKYSKTKKTIPIRIQLNAPQKETLRAVILKTEDPSTASSYLGIFPFLDYDKDSELLSHLAKLLLKDDKKYLYVSQALMLAIYKCSEDPEIKELFTSLYMNSKIIKSLPPKRQARYKKDILRLARLLDLTLEDVNSFIDLLKKKGLLKKD